MKELIGQAKVRDATVAGIFYPDEPSELEARIASMLEASKPAFSDARAILSPHAGLDYAGDLSALAWKASSARDIETVLILAPLHRAEESLIYLPEADYFEMPIGSVTVDREIVGEMLERGSAIRENDIPHFEEHGIELQLPFMIAQFPSARLVPVLMGKPSESLVRTLAAALSSVFAGRIESTLVVLSSDLGSDDEAEVAAASADRFVRDFLAQDSLSILDGLRAGTLCACGSGCAAAYFASGLAKGMRPTLLGRHDSSASRETGDERLVHYAAIALRDA